MVIPPEIPEPTNRAGIEEGTDIDNRESVGRWSHIETANGQQLQEKRREDITW
jgi:hypothetical protein